VKFKYVTPSDECDLAVKWTRWARSGCCSVTERFVGLTNCEECWSGQH